MILIVLQIYQPRFHLFQRPVVPVFNLTLEAVAKAQEYFYELEPNVTNTASVITLEEDEGIDCDGGGGDAGAERVQLQKSK